MAGALFVSACASGGDFDEPDEALLDSFEQ
jgi:hypothetical protein